MRTRLLLCLLLATTAQAAPKRQYFPVAPSAMAHNFHTHVRVTGVVTYVQRESDGDRHFTVCEPGTKKFTRAACIVAECIPALPCAVPKVGEKVTVYGIARFDGEHKWAEVHPVEKWSAGQ
jgi:hypothetical protein